MVFIYASQPPHQSFRPGVFSWAGKLGAVVKAVERGPRSGQHPGDVIDKLAGRTFETDPILTAEQTRLAGVINSAVGQHGKLIEKAILECLQDQEGFAARDEPEFRFSHGDTNYHKAATVAGAALAQLPYGDI